MPVTADVDAAVKGGVWSGPVTSPGQAARIVRWAGWLYLLLALPYPAWTAYIGARAAGGLTVPLLAMLPGLLFMGPGLLLLLLRNRAAAVIQTIAAGWSALTVLVGGSAATIMAVADAPEAGLHRYVLWLEGAVLLLVAAWTACAFLALRAFKAARVLRAGH